MSPLPLPILLFFLFTVLVGFILFTRAAANSRTALTVVLAWIALQSAIALSTFYLNTKTVPPHLFLALIPPILVIAVLFAIPAGRAFLDTMSLKWLVLLHSIRILVEINLYWLFLYKQVPRLMTFEGGNVDILIGLSAPIIWWAYSKGHLARRGLLIWNTVAILSVLTAFLRAMLSAPFRFQHLAFDQPTIAILYFPFVLLPAFLVPTVLFCHLVLYRRISTTAR
jgi:hypothetical protein